MNDQVFNYCAFRLFKHVKEMRDAQRRYFKSRDKHVLREAFALEKEVDKDVDSFAKIYAGEAPEGALDGSR